MVNEAIVRHLQQNKRLVIPSFGAFLHRDTGEVVFSEFLRKDDGALAGELTARGLTAAQAAAEIDRYVQRLRKAAARPEGYAIPGLGVVRSDEEGLIGFTYDPATVAMQVERPIPPAPQPAAPTAPAGQPGTDRDAAQTSPATQPVAPKPMQAQPADTPKPQPQSGTDTFRDHFPDRPGVWQQDEPRPGTQATGHKDTSGQDDDLRGMKYQKPSRQGVDPRKRRSDLIMIIAIAAAAIAIAVMVYAMVVEPKPSPAPPRVEEVVP